MTLRSGGCERHPYNPPCARGCFECHAQARQASLRRSEDVRVTVHHKPGPGGTTWSSMVVRKVREVGL